MPNVISAAEIEHLLRVSTAIAEEQLRVSTDATNGVAIVAANGVRMHVPRLFPSADVALCNEILSRSMAFIDTELPNLASELFFTRSTLCELHADGELTFSKNEPAVNVYFENGYFNPHKDYCALTVLIPLTSPGDGSFVGGGTGFWAPESRGAPSAEPALELAPPAGTAMIFSGDVMHAGLPVKSGKRVVFVASFDRRGLDLEEEVDIGDER